MLPTRRRRHLAALIVATMSHAAAGQETTPEVSFEAESVFYDARKGSSVYKGLSVSDGTVSISANEGVATRNERDEGTLEFSGAVEVTFESSVVSADSATFRFAAGRLTEGEVIGRPAEFETSATEGPRSIRGTAGRISYDRSQGVLSARDGVSFAYDATTVRNCNWTYSLNDGAFSVFSADDAKCAVSVAVFDESR